MEENFSQMETEEKRKHQRFNSLNLSYICLDEDQQAVKQGMGRTLNLPNPGSCWKLISRSRRTIPSFSASAWGTTWSMSTDVRFAWT